jgi:SAM-dependent methyltransferase
LSSDSWDAAGKGGKRAARRTAQSSAAKRRERSILPPAASGGGAQPGFARPEPAAAQGAESSYDAIAALYDPWSRSVTEDVDFYVAEARKAGGPVVELGVGTGRIAIPTAQAGIRVIGIDSSSRMLALCRQRAEEAGVAELIDLREGDLQGPSVDERVPLVTSPFRSLLHLPTDAARRKSMAAVHEVLEPGGRFVFDVFTPSREDVAETHGRWLEREKGIWERAEWNIAERTLDLSVKGAAGTTTMRLAWVSPDEWRKLLEGVGFAVEACYGWFDRRPYGGGEDSIWVARRPAKPSSPPPE